MEWMGLDAELRDLEARDPAVKKSKEREHNLAEADARYERHLAARKAVGKRKMPKDMR